MPLYTATQAGGGSQFAGTTAANGLLSIASTGASNVRLWIVGVSFSTSSTIVGWTLNIVNPATSQVIPLLTDTTTSFALGGPQGFMLLPIAGAVGAASNVPFQLTFVTDTMAAAGTLNIDYGFQPVP